VFVDILFYGFSSLLMLSATMVVASRNAVYSVLYLIFAFFNASALFVMIGAEFLAMVLLIVYVGAVAVLFLFVVMMLESPAATMKEKVKPYVSVASSLAVVGFLEIVFFLIYKYQPAFAGKSLFVSPSASHSALSNTHHLGLVLYTDYFYAFQLVGLILLSAMVAAIVLTLHHASDVKRQVVQDQLDRDPNTSAVLVDVAFGKGVEP